MPPDTPPAPPAASIGVYGKVTDATTGAPVEGVCVTLGQPGAFCWATTDSAGNYSIDGDGVVSPSQTDWQLYMLKQPLYPVQGTDFFKLTGGLVRKDWRIHR